MEVKADVNRMSPERMAKIHLGMSFFLWFPHGVRATWGPAEQWLTDHYMLTF